MAWRRRVWSLVLVTAAAGAVLAAEAPELSTKVTDVTVFKDGHALVMASGAVELRDGWCRTRDVPVPVLGTFWAFVADGDAKVGFVKAGFAETKTTRPCLSFDEMLQANVGKAVDIVEQPKDAPAITHRGTLAGILQHDSTREAEVSRIETGRYDRWRGHSPNRQVRETREDEGKALASFVMLKSDDGVKLIQRANIRSIAVRDPAVATTCTETKKVREISMHLTRDGKPLAGKHQVGMVYLQKGVRWIPNYRIELLDGGKARVSLHGTIINDLADLENATVRLVVGVPSFIMKDARSPMALREVGLRLSSYFAPPARGGGATMAQYLSNALMSQSAAPAMEGAGGAAAGGPDIPGQGQQEDLFVYQKEGLSLAKGERAVVHLLDVVVPYEDIYVWDIPCVPPQEMWRHVGRREQQQLARALTGAKAMHKIRLTNTGKAPWTTGPATIFKDNTPLAQQLLTYTSIKNKVDVSITIATDLNTKKEEAEVGRKRDDLVIGDTHYTRVSVHGKLTITNFKDKPVRLVVTRHVVGTLTKASHDGKTIAGNALEDTLLRDGDYPWYWWNWPWWWLRVNRFSQITWEATLDKGKAVTLEYDWYHHYVH